MRHLILLLFTLLSLTPAILSARTTATSFCKCVCFSNSTIIALNPPTTSPSPDANARRDTTSHKLSCADCNRAFCLSQNLQICKKAEEDDVFATCFQRDSVKDETVVLLFLIATGGLLGWALVKPWVERAREGRYLPLRGVGGDAGRSSAQSRDTGVIRTSHAESSISGGSGGRRTEGDGLSSEAG